MLFILSQQFLGETPTLVTNLQNLALILRLIHAMQSGSLPKMDLLQD